MFLLQESKQISSMMMDYDNVVELLANVQNENKANSVADQIQSRSEDPRFVSLLQHAIRDHHLPHNVRLAAVVVLSRVVSEKHTEWNEEFQIDCLLGIVSDPSVQYRFKQSFESNLTEVLELSSPHIFKGVLQKASQALLLLPRNQQQMQVDESTLQKVPDLLKTVLLLLRSLLNSNAHFGDFSYAIQDYLLESILNIKILITTSGIDALIALAQFWKSVIELAKGEASKDHSQLLKWLARSQLLTEWIFQLYGIDHLMGQFCFINPQSQLDHEHLGELKTAAANLHATVLMAIEQSRQSSVEELTNRHLSQLTFITNTVMAFSSHRSLCTTYDSFITSLLGVVILMVKLHPKHFATICDRLLHIIVFPFLAVTQEEQQLFADDPEEFNNLAQDCCDRQAYGLLKTQAARLLETFCDQIRGPSEYTIQHAIISIKIKLCLETNLTQDAAQHFLPLEEALFVLAILSYRLSKYTKELNELRLALKVSSVMERISPLQMARLFQFFAYNYQQIYRQISEGQQWIYLALTTSIQQSQKHPTLAYAALDFLSNVIENYFSQSFALAYMQRSVCTSQLQFKIFIKIVSKHYLQFTEEGLCSALDGLLQVVLADVEKYRRGEKKHTMDIVHSLQTVRKIVEKNNYLKDKQQLRNIIWQFVSYFQLFCKIQAEEQIVKLVTALIKFQGLSKDINGVFPQILELYQTQNFTQTAYIVFLNQIAVRSNDAHSSGVFEPLFRAAEQLYYNIEANPTSITDNLALANTLLVFQHIIGYFGETIAKQTIREVACLACKIIPTSDEPQDKIDPIVLARALNLLFLCHMHCKDDRALKRMLVFQEALLFRGHDLKVFTACLTKQLFRQSDIVAVTEMINLLIAAIWKTNSEYIPSVRSKNNPSAKKKSTVIRIKKIADFQVALRTMTQPFDTSLVPELELKNAIDKMRLSNSMLFQAIIRSLPSQRADHLRALMSEVTIEGQKRTIVRAGEVKSSNDQTLTKHPSRKRVLQPSDDEEIFEDEADESPNRKKEAKKKRKEETTLSD